MAETNELDLKLLDRAVERHSSDQQAFWRDLKIAAALIVVFQFGVFFRYVNLSDQGQKIKSDLDQVQAAQTTLADVQSALAGIGHTIEIGKHKVAESLGQGQSELRSQILAFNAGLRRLKVQPQGTAKYNAPAKYSGNGAPTHGPVGQFPRAGNEPAGITSKVPGVIAPSANAPAEITQSVVSLPPELSDLGPHDLALLRDERDADQINTLLRSIVNEKIVARVFEGLNHKKAEWLDDPLQAKEKALAVLLEARSKDLAGYGWKSEQVMATVAQVRESARSFHIKPPPNEYWWTTIEGKGETFHSLVVDSDRAYSQIQSSLDDPRKSLDKLGLELKALATVAGEKKSALDVSLKKLEDESAKAKEMIAGVAKPLSTLSLDAKDVVRYDPSILSVAVVFFLARYWWIRRRASVLAAECRMLGYSDRMVSLYFANQPWTLGSIPTVAEYAVIRRAMKALSFAAPGVLAIVSAGRILASPSLYPIAPTALYALTISALLAAYLVMSLQALRSRSGIAVSTS
jgi:hypothetical protein